MYLKEKQYKLCFWRFCWWYPQIIASMSLFSILIASQFSSCFCSLQKKNVSKATKLHCPFSCYCFEKLESTEMFYNHYNLRMLFVLSIAQATYINTRRHSAEALTPRLTARLAFYFWTAGANWIGPANIKLRRASFGALAQLHAISSLAHPALY